MKKKLILLSDLLGFPAEYYKRLLSDEFEIDYFDVRDLAGIDKNQTKEEIHKQLVEFGIDHAVQKLLELKLKASHLLAFSIGGVIAWRYALKTDQVKEFWAISATRLRVESEKPEMKVNLFYGEKDAYRPNENWFKKMQISPEIILGKEHEMYGNTEFAEYLIEKLMRKKNIS